MRDAQIVLLGSVAVIDLVELGTAIIRSTRALIALRPIGRDTHGNQVHQRLTGDQLPVDDASHHRGRTFDDPSVQPR